MVFIYGVQYDSEPLPPDIIRHVDQHRGTCCFNGVFWSWCTHIAISVSAQYDGGPLPDITRHIDQRLGIHL